MIERHVDAVVVDDQAGAVEPIDGRREVPEIIRPVAAPGQRLRRRRGRVAGDVGIESGAGEVRSANAIEVSRQRRETDVGIIVIVRRNRGDLGEVVRVAGGTLDQKQVLVGGIVRPVQIDLERADGGGGQAARRSRRRGGHDGEQRDRARRIGQRNRLNERAGQHEVGEAAGQRAGVGEQRIDSATEKTLRLIDRDRVRAGQHQVADDVDAIVGFARAGRVAGKIELIQNVSGFLKLVGNGQSTRDAAAGSGRERASGLQRCALSESSVAAHRCAPHAAVRRDRAAIKTAVDQQRSFRDRSETGESVRVVDRQFAGAGFGQRHRAGQ